MSVGGLTPTQLQDIQRLYQRTDGYYSYSRDEDRTSDGHCILKTSYSGGDCMSEGFSAIDATRDDQSYYSHRCKPGKRFSHPAIREDGKVGYVACEERGRDGYSQSIRRVPLNSMGLLKWPTTVLDLEQGVDALTLSPDGKTLAFARDNQIFTWDCKGGIRHFFRSLFHTDAGVKSEMTMPERIHDLHYLSDGSLMVWPESTWQKACYVVKPGVQGSTRITMREMAPERFREQVISNYSFLRSDEVDRFVEKAGSLVDDEASQRANAWGRAADGKIAVGMLEDGGSSGLYTWDGSDLKRVASIPTVWNRDEVRWSPDGARVYVAHHNLQEPLVSIIDVGTGRVSNLPGVDSTASLQATKDGSRLGAIGPKGQVWVYEGATGEAKTLQTLEPPLNPWYDKSLRWTEDGRHAVVSYHVENVEGLAVNIIGVDGTTAIIPRADEVKFEADVLQVVLGGETHTVAVPADLATLEQQAWYQRSCGTAVLGGSSTADPDAKVEREEDQVVIGGIKVPVRREGAGAPNTAPAPASEPASPPVQSSPEVAYIARGGAR